MSDDKALLAGRSLVRSLANEDLEQVTNALGEVAIDSLLQDGVVREIPILGLALGIGRTVGAIRDELFIRKLIRFLDPLGRVPPEQRRKLLTKYPDGSEKQHELGEHLLLALERLDDVRKAEILARLFLAFLKDEVDSLMFSRLRFALERFNLEMFDHLRWFYLRDGKKVDLTEDIEHELSLAGLVSVSLAGSGSIAGGAGFGGSEVGRQFLKSGFGVEST